MANSEEKLPSKDIIRNYKGNPFQKFHRQSKGTKIIIEKLIDPNKQLELSRNKKADLIPAEILYQHGFWERSPKVYQHRSEEIISCCSEEQQIQLDFLTEESQKILQKQGYSIIHIGLVMIGINSLHRLDYGSKILVALIPVLCLSPLRGGTREGGRGRRSLIGIRRLFIKTRTHRMDLNLLGQTGGLLEGERERKD